MSKCTTKNRPRGGRRAHGGADLRLRSRAMLAGRRPSPTWPCRCSSTSIASAGFPKSPAAELSPDGFVYRRPWSRWFRLVSSRVSIPVTVKTRIGLGPESHMPIVDLARRLEDAGAAALTIHCRTAEMGHSGAADWSWAAQSASIGRHSGYFRQRRRAVGRGCSRSSRAKPAARGSWSGGAPSSTRGSSARREPSPRPRNGRTAPPTRVERLDLCCEHLVANVAQRGEPFGVHCTRRHLGPAI